MKSQETKSMVLLHHHLKALRLPTIGAECEKVTNQAAADNVDHLAYLLQLTELELLERERKAAGRRLKAARFPTMKSLDNFDFTARPSVNKMLIAELARCEFIDKRENVLLVGNPGTGKGLSHFSPRRSVFQAVSFRLVKGGEAPMVRDPPNRAATPWDAVVGLELG